MLQEPKTFVMTVPHYQIEECYTDWLRVNSKEIRRKKVLLFSGPATKALGALCLLLA